MGRDCVGETDEGGGAQWSAQDPTFPHPPPRQPPDYSHRFHLSPHSGPQSFFLLSSPRTPAQTPNFFPRFHFRSQVNSPRHPQSALHVVPRASSVVAPTVLASTPPLFPLASHQSCCRSRRQIPSLPPRDAPDETGHPSPAAAKSVSFEMQGHRLSVSPPFSLRQATVAPPSTISRRGTARR